MARKAGVAVAVIVLVVGVTLLLVSRTTMERFPPFVPGPPEGEIAIAYPEEPATLNPYSFEGDTGATRDLLRPVLPTLLALGPDLEYRPSLAVRVPSGRDITFDPFTVSFRLDDAAVWSDGVPVTAEDIRFTWEVVRASPNQKGYDRIRDVEVIEPTTARLIFDSPYPAWRDLFSAGDFLLPKHALEGKDLGAELARGVPVGSGPFSIVQWTPGLEIVYEPNSNWWGSGPRIARVRVLFVPGILTALQLLEARRVDAVVATSQINLTRRFERLEDVEVASRFGSAWWELAFNHQKPHASDRLWRRAVATGFDRAGIVEALIREEGRELQHLSPGRDLAGSFAAFTFDREASRSALRQAGYSQRAAGSFTKQGTERPGISVAAENEIATLVQRSIQAGLRETGIEVEVRNPRFETFWSEWRRDGRFDLALWERRSTPYAPYLPFYHSARLPPSGINYYRLASSAVDEAMTSAEYAEEFAKGPLDTVMAGLAEDLPALPLFEAKAYVGYRSGIEGPDPNATVEGPFWNLEKWVVSR